MNKLDEYLSSESQRQFPDAKREQIEASRLGKSKMSPATEAAYNKAVAKSRNIDNCIWCGAVYVERNSREEVKLCSKCSQGRQAILWDKRRHGWHTLKEEDVRRISNSKITRYGRQNP